MILASLISRSSLLVEHDLFRKPVSTFRDHALGTDGRRAGSAARNQNSGRKSPSAVVLGPSAALLAHARDHRAVRVPHLHDRLRAALGARLLSHADVRRPWLGARGIRALGRA